LFLAPGTIVLTLVMIYPTVQAFNISLHDWSVVPGVESVFVGVGNYRRAFNDPIFWRSIANGGIYMLVTVPLQLLLGLACAVTLDSRFPGRTTFRAVIYVPVISSWVVASLLFRFLFRTESGLINQILSGTSTFIADPIDWLGGRWTALAVVAALGVWKGVGWAMLIFLAALQSVPAELHEAAAVDGAGPMQRFAAVTIPAIRRTFSLVTIFLVIGGFNVFISVYLITNGGPADQTQVPLTYLYRQAFLFLDFGYGSAIAFMLTGLIFAISAGQIWLSRRTEELSLT